MKKLVLLIVCLLIVVGITFFLLGWNRHYLPDRCEDMHNLAECRISECEKKQNLSKNRCFLGLALGTKNSSYCHLIDWARQREYCLLEFAVDDGNSSYCQQVTNEYVQGECNAEFAIISAGETQNMSYCKGLTKDHHRRRCCGELKGTYGETMCLRQFEGWNSSV